MGIGHIYTKSSITISAELVEEFLLQHDPWDRVMGSVLLQCLSHVEVAE